MYLTDLQNIGIPAGTFGTVAGSLVPSQNVFIPQGNNTLFSSGTTDRATAHPVDSDSPGQSDGRRRGRSFP